MAEKYLLSSPLSLSLILWPHLCHCQSLPLTVSASPVCWNVRICSPKASSTTVISVFVHCVVTRENISSLETAAVVFIAILSWWLITCYQLWPCDNTNLFLTIAILTPKGQWTDCSDWVLKELVKERFSVLMVLGDTMVERFLRSTLRRCSMRSHLFVKGTVLFQPQSWLRECPSKVQEAQTSNGFKRRKTCIPKMRSRQINKHLLLSPLHIDKTGFHKKFTINTPVVQASGLNAFVDYFWHRVLFERIFWSGSIGHCLI